MNRANVRPVALVLLAAAFFGASIPVSKTVLSRVPPLELSGVVYLFSGAAAGLYGLLRRASSAEAPIQGRDWIWMAGVVLAGGVAGPVLLFLGLDQTPAHVASLLAGSETLFTLILAVAFFGDRLLRREILGCALILIGATLVSSGGSDRGGTFRWIGPMLLLASGLVWGLDNNLTGRLSKRNPLQIAAVKGLASGAFSLGLAAATKSIAPFEPRALGVAALVGVICYGLSFVVFIYAMRRLGAARTSSIYATAPVFGVLLSWLLLGEVPRLATLAGGALMIPGVLLFIRPETAPAEAYRAGTESTGPSNSGPPPAT